MTARRYLVVGAAVAAVLASAPTAWAYFGLQAQAPVSASAAVLETPGALEVTMLPDSTLGLRARVAWTVNQSSTDGSSDSSTDGDADATKPDAYLVERQPALDPSADWTAVDGSVDCAVTATDGEAGHIECSLVDVLPAGQGDVAYRYRVRSLRGTHWQSDPTAPELVASLAPDAAQVGTGDYQLNGLAASPDGSGLVAVGSGGTVLVCAGRCGDDAAWAPVPSGTGEDLVDVAPAPTGDGVLAVTSDGAQVACASDCGSPAGTWTAADPTAGASDGAAGAAGDASSSDPASDGAPETAAAGAGGAPAAAPSSDPVTVEHGGHRWRLVPGDPPQIQRWDGDTWVDQQLPAQVGGEALEAPDGRGAVLGVLPPDTDLGGAAGCPEAGLRASVEVPGALSPSNSSISASLSLQLDYAFSGGEGSGWVALLTSTDGGHAWSAPIFAGPSAGGQAALHLTDASDVRTLDLCLAGIGKASALRVDQLRLLVNH